jgi:hypothetical protein
VVRDYIKAILECGRHATALARKKSGGIAAVLQMGAFLDGLTTGG